MCEFREFSVAPVVIKMMSFLRRQLHKKLILRTFQLDAPILPTLRRIGASNRNVGKISFFCAVVYKENPSNDV